MWIAQLAIVVCLMAGMGNAQRTQPTRSPTTPTLTSPTTDPPDTDDPLIPQGGCLHKLISQPIAQSARRFLAIPKRGQSRAFGRRFPVVNTQLQSQSTGRPNVPVAVVSADLADQVARDPTVDRVELDQPVCVDLQVPDPDPTANRSRRSFEPDEICWNIDRLDERELPLDGQYCPAADGTGVDVYILDSGINYNHQVFNGRARFGGFDQFSGSGEDCHGHGTHCAGLAVGRLTGVAWGARVFSIRVLDCQLGGFFSYVISGINHVIDRARVTGRRSVISMSLIGPITEAINVAIREAVANNVVVVTAAGNFRQDSCEYSPSSSPDVINVGGIQEALDDRYRNLGHMLYWFNSRSNSPGSNYGRCVDIFAPGQWIRSASHTSNVDRVSMSGTSMACPTTAGVVATLLQRFPNYTPRQIKDRLIQEANANEINFRFYRGSQLPSVIQQTTPNRLVYTGRCSNRPETVNPPSGTPSPTTPPPTPGPPQLAGCVFNGRLYDHGTNINQNCSTRCRCNRGTWRCEPKKCYARTCQAYTFGHYRTFDGTSYEYQGTCEYVLVKPCSNNDFTISVVQEALTSGVVEIKSVIIAIQGSKIVFEGGNVLIDGERFQRFDGNMMTVGEVIVQWIAGLVHATFEDQGIDVLWDGPSSIQVSVANSLRGQLCGLCGFYNNKASDDLRTSSMSVATNVNNFALSWLRGSGNTNNRCRPTTSDRTCSNRDRNRGERFCRKLNNVPFSSCHSKVNPQPYITNCLNDYCNCSGSITPRREGCACKVIESYIMACAQAGVNSENWRANASCDRECSGERNYKECGSFCQLTCSNYQSPPSCSKDCAPGCFCSDGQVLKGGQCVDPDTCDDQPICKGTCLPPNNPYHFERFYLAELDDFIADGVRLNSVPTHVNVYRDDSDLLFAVIFSNVQNASACNILPSATSSQVNKMRNRLRRTHRIVTLSCYHDNRNRFRCLVIFCPRRQNCAGRGTRSLPGLQCSIRQRYASYQTRQLKQQERGFRVCQRKLYFEGDDLLVDVCYVKLKGLSVALYDSVDLRTLIQTVDRNKQRGLYLTDGNARLVGTTVVYSAVFTTKKYGKCDYIVIYNVDGLQLYERVTTLAEDGYHITAIIPTTGSLTPLFIAVFWR